MRLWNQNFLSPEHLFTYADTIHLASTPSSNYLHFFDYIVKLIDRPKSD